MRTVTLVYDDGDALLISAAVPILPETAAAVIAGISVDTAGLASVRFHPLPGEGSAALAEWVGRFGVALSLHFGGRVVRASAREPAVTIPRGPCGRPLPALLPGRRFLAHCSSLSVHTFN
jgi:hypothetical protein